MAAKVLVTGANGNLGANLTCTLLDAGHAVRAMIYTPNKALDRLNVEITQGDIRDADCVRAAVEGCSVVFHLAAKITILPKADDTVRNINVGGTRNVTAACLKEGVSRLVHCSSIHALDQHTDGELTEEQPLAATDTPPYDRTKSEAEGVIQSAVQSGLDAVIVNPCAIIGPHDYAPSRMGRVLLDIACQRLPALVQGAYTFVDARDVARGFLLALQHGKRGERYLLGGHYLTIKQLATLISKVTGASVPRFTVPWWLARLGSPFGDLYGRVSQREPLYTSVSLDVLRQPKASHKKASRELGYNPRPIMDTLKDTYDWFEQHGYM